MKSKHQLTDALEKGLFLNYRDVITFFCWGEQRGLVSNPRITFSFQPRRCALFLIKVDDERFLFVTILSHHVCPRPRLAGGLHRPLRPYEIFAL